MDIKARKKLAYRSSLKARRPLRRYGATVYTEIDIEWAGRALKALEHAPEIQVLDFVKVKKEPGIQKITMRSLVFPRFWEGTEVDLYGDAERGLVAIYHPSILE
jgi:hypothetical protein